MAARRKLKPVTGYDLRRAIAAHGEASKKAHAWAEKAIGLRDAGMPTAADRAEAKAAYWLRRKTALEAIATRGKPESGRRSKPE
jgi:hypothetical protein